MKKHQIEIAEPCHAAWDAMSGDTQRRFCDQCQKHVHNLSAMPRVAAVELLRQQQGPTALCVRYGADGDGNVQFTARRVPATAPAGQRRGASALVARAAAIAGTLVALTQREASAGDDPVWTAGMPALDLPVEGSGAGSGAGSGEGSGEGALSGLESAEPCEPALEMGQVPRVQPPVPMIQGGLPPMQFSPTPPKALKAIGPALEDQELRARAALAAVGITVEETEIVEQNVVAQVALEPIGDRIDSGSGEGASEGSGAAEGTVEVVDVIPTPVKIDDNTDVPILMGRMAAPRHP